MSNPFEEAQTADADLSQFVEWLEETAEREGASTDELLGQLVNTHWILSELTELVEESQFEAEPSARSTADGDDEPSNSPSELLEVVRAFTESQSQTTQQQSTGGQAIDQSVLELVRALNTGGAPQQPQAPAQAGGMSYRDVRAMVEDINDVENDVAELRQQVSGTLGDLESTVSELTDAVQSNTASIDELEAAGAERTQRIEGIESRFDASYDDIREILTHLIDTTNEQDATLETIVDTYEEDIGDLKSQTSDREALSQLKQEAARRDIKKATCEGCDSSFRVSLLGSPACPHCDREIEEFGERSGSFNRSTHTARVRSLPEGGDTTSLSTRVDRSTRSATADDSTPSLPEEPDWWEPASDN